VDEEPERVVQVTANPAWLPTGSRADVIRRSTPLQPMCIVRLLIRRGDEVFCRPREETAKPDLPMRVTEGDDPSGSLAIGLLVHEVLGHASRSSFIGAVRNVVTVAGSNYPWPTPLAYFGVWSTQGEPIVEGAWVNVADATSVLRNRHWYPLLT
jgi:hypothetical protein